jgi:hypothetical protein
MPLGLVRDEFRIVLTQPDEDSAQFFCDDPDAFTLRRRRAQLIQAERPAAPAGYAIDALKTQRQGWWRINCLVCVRSRQGKVLDQTWTSNRTCPR